MTVEVGSAHAPLLAEARLLFEEYAASLSFDLGSQGFDSFRARGPAGRLGPERGARRGGLASGGSGEVTTRACRKDADHGSRSTWADDDRGRAAYHGERRRAASAHRSAAAVTASGVVVISREQQALRLTAEVIAALETVEPRTYAIHQLVTAISHDRERLRASLNAGGLARLERPGRV